MFLKGFPGVCRGRKRLEGHSRANENGINKKHLPRLNSIVNLAKLFRVSFGRSNVAKYGSMKNTAQRFRRGLNMLTATIDAFQALPIANFSIGDVVTLKEGGPRMTVTYAGPVALNPGDWLICEWFDEHGELRREMFSPASVRTEPRSIPAGSVLWGKLGRAA
jgi:uncharacterized protein YodC (DUF2158 family)